MERMESKYGNFGLEFREYEIFPGIKIGGKKIILYRLFCLAILKRQYNYIDTR